MGHHVDSCTVITKFDPVIRERPGSFLEVRIFSVFVNPIQAGWRAQYAFPPPPPPPVTAFLCCAETVWSRLMKLSYF